MKNRMKTKKELNKISRFERARRTKTSKGQSVTRMNVRQATGMQNDAPNSSKFAQYSGVYIQRNNKFHKESTDPTRTLSLNKGKSKNNVKDEKNKAVEAKV